MSTILRVSHNRNNPYVTINKTALEDSRLSWKAKGLLAYLLSKPDNWTVYSSELIKRAEDGERSVRSGLKELEEYGYLERHRVRERNEQGKWVFTGWETVVYEQPLKLVKPDPEGAVPKRRFAESQNVELQNVELQNSRLISNEEISNEVKNNDFKEKKKIPKPKKKGPDGYEEWYEHAYSQGWVVGRRGENVALKIGPLAGCMRHWKEVAGNLDYFLSPTEPLKPGFLTAAIKQGLQQSKSKRVNL